MTRSNKRFREFINSQDTTAAEQAVKTYHEFLLTLHGPTRGLEEIMLINAAIRIIGPANSDHRTAFNTMLATIDAQFQAACQDFANAESYRDTMLRD